MGLLVETWVSKANAKQRQGRAGRVQKGNCYRMYTRRKFESLDAQQVREQAPRGCPIAGAPLWPAGMLFLTCVLRAPLGARASSGAPGAIVPPDLGHGPEGRAQGDIFCVALLRRSHAPAFSPNVLRPPSLRCPVSWHLPRCARHGKHRRGPRGLAQPQRC